MAVQNQITLGINSPVNTLAIQNSPVTGSGEISIDLAVQQGLVAGTYTNPCLTLNEQGVVTAASSGSTPPISSLTLTSPSGTLTLSNTSMTSNGQGVAQSTIDMQCVAGVAGVYNNPSSMTVDAYGRVTAATSGVLAEAGTVISVGLNSPMGTLSVTGQPVTYEGMLNADLPVIAGLPQTTVAVPCAAVGVDAYGRVTVLGEVPSLTVQSPGGSMTISQQQSSSTMLTVNADVAPSGVKAGTVAVPTSLTVGGDGRITAITGTSEAGVVTNITSQSETLALTPAGGTLGSNQVSVNVDLPVQGGVGPEGGTFNSVTVDSYGRVVQGVVQPNLEQVNLSSESGSILVSNGALTKENNGTSLDLVKAFEGVPGETIPVAGNVVINAFGQVTSASPVTSTGGTIAITGGTTGANIDLVKQDPTQFCGTPNGPVFNSFGICTGVQGWQILAAGALFGGDVPSQGYPATVGFSTPTYIAQSGSAVQAYAFVSPLEGTGYTTTPSSIQEWDLPCNYQFTLTCHGSGGMPPSLAWFVVGILTDISP